MAAKLKTYDPDRCVITYGPHKLEGFGPDARISITYPVMFNAVEGTDGEVARGKTNASSLDIEVPLLQSSESNDFLSGFFLGDVGAPTGAPLPFFFKYLDNAETVISPGAWIPQLPRVEKKAGVGINVWKFKTGPATYFIGGLVRRV